MQLMTHLALYLISKIWIWFIMHSNRIWVSYSHFYVILIYCYNIFSLGSLKLQQFRDELESHKNELTIAAESLITKRWLKANLHFSAFKLFIFQIFQISCWHLFFWLFLSSISFTDFLLFFNSRSQNTHKGHANEERRVKLERERLKYKQVKVNLENSKNHTLKAEEIARWVTVALMERYSCEIINERY